MCRYAFVGIAVAALSGGMRVAADDHILAVGAVTLASFSDDAYYHQGDEFLVNGPTLPPSCVQEPDGGGLDCGCSVDCGEPCTDCGSACDCSSGCLLGLFQSSDHRFDRFISPITNPVFFEDPRTLTEARGIFAQHKIPLAAGGDDLQVYAVQVRAALTDRLSMIVTKDGYVVSQNPLIRDGWADVAMGLKYNIVANSAAQRLLSAGLVYELPVGSTRTLQGNGDGEFNLFLTGGTQFLDFGHWLSASGIRLPVDDGAESQSCYWSNHFDYEVVRHWYVLSEFNWYHWIKSGDNGIPGVEGVDFFNFGSTGVAGNDIVTGAFGVKYKPSGHVELGVVWELPLTERRDVLENRITADVILRY